MNNMYTPIAFIMAKFSYNTIYYGNVNVSELVSGIMCVLGSWKLIDLFLYIKPTITYSDVTKVVEKDVIAVENVSEEEQTDITDVCNDADALICNTRQLIEEKH